MPSTQPIRVLLVEDDEDDYLLTRDVIETIDGDYEIVWRETFEKGSAALKDEPFDVGLIDYRIGGRTGIDFVSEVRSAGCDVPMILLTGMQDREVDMAASAAGAADYLEKSAITPALAERAIRFARASAAAQRALAEQSGLLQATLDNTGSAIAALDPQGRLIACNHRLRELVAGLTTLSKPNGAQLAFASGEERDIAAVLSELMAFAGAKTTSEGELSTPDNQILKLSVNRTDQGGSVAVIQDITEQKRHEETLRRAKESAEGASRSKSAFLATMGHELRTPLNAVIGFAELMLSGSHGELQPQAYSEYTRMILDSGHNLLGIINAILDFSKAEAGRYELDKEELSIKTQFEFCLRAMEPSAEGQRIDLTADLAHADCSVFADSTVLRRMMMNVLSNAIKFTGEGGCVQLSAKPQADGSLSIVVTDTGIGIAEENLSSIFQPFYQVHSALDRSYEGTGLGLSIVKSLAELHGARVEVESTLGVGTSVALTFPQDAVIAAEPTKSAVGAA